MEKADKKPVSVNPIKTSPAIGAAYAIQGIKGALPLLHAAPGCTFLGKVLLTQHTNEPVGVMGTDTTEISTIFGGSDLLEQKIREIKKKNNPDLIAIVSTALTEVKGEDIEGSIKKLESEIDNIVYIPAPDYIGGFDEGFSKAVEVLIEKYVQPGEKIKNQVNILAGSSFTPIEIEEIKDLLEIFGFKAVVIPDLSLSMEGSKEKHSPLPLDGTTLDNICIMGKSEYTLCFGSLLKDSAEKIKEKADIPFYQMPLPIGIEANDMIIKLLIELSGKNPADSIKRWRQRLVDTMVDSHLHLSGKEVSVALENDHLTSLVSFLLNLGMKVKAFSTQKFSFNNSSGNLKIFENADLEDLELQSKESSVIITNSHGQQVADRLNKHIIKMGFPIFDEIGNAYQNRIGYRGTLNLLLNIINPILDEERRKHS